MQAAILLLLGRQLRGDDLALIARGKNVRGATILPSTDELDSADFPVPTLPATSEKVSGEGVRNTLAKRHGKKIIRGYYDKDESKNKWPEAYADLGEKLYQTPTIENAAELMELCLKHPDDLTRVAAASAYFSLRAEPKDLMKILVSGTRSDEALVRNVAAMTLSRIAPDHPSLRRLKSGKQPKDGREPAHTSTIIHGTFAASHTWWQPDGGFHTYLGGVRDDLYNGADRFGWSGGFSDLARDQAAIDLVKWVNEHGVQGLDLFGHSHGGNVMMLATHSGLTAGKLILLSCPVHVDKYSPNFAKVERVISIRVRLDLVILADWGGQRFNHPKIEENVLPIWFNHSATHEPNVWRDEDLLEKI